MPRFTSPRFVDRIEDFPPPGEFAASTGVAEGQLVDAADRLRAQGSAPCLIFGF